MSRSRSPRYHKAIRTLPDRGVIDRCGNVVARLKHNLCGTGEEQECDLLLQELDAILDGCAVLDDSSTVLRAIGLKLLVYTLLKPEYVLPAGLISEANHYGEPNCGCHQDTIDLGQVLLASTSQQNGTARVALVYLYALALAGQVMDLSVDAVTQLYANVSSFLARTEEQCFICLENFTSSDGIDDTQVVAPCGHAVHYTCFVKIVIPKSVRWDDCARDQSQRGHCRLCRQPFRWSCVAQTVWRLKGLDVLTTCIRGIVLSFENADGADVPDAVVGTSLQQLFGTLVCSIGGGKSIAQMCEIFAVEMLGDADQRWQLWQDALAMLERSGVVVPPLLKRTVERFLNIEVTSSRQVSEREEDDSTTDEDEENPVEASND